MVELLDLKDRKLISELDFNARAPLSELGKKLGLSKQVVKYRIEKLQEKGIIKGFYTDINASKLGYEIFLVYLKFHNLTSKIETEFIRHISSQNYVGVNVSLNGLWDFCIGIWAKNSIHFKKIYQKIMRNYEKYVKSKTIMIETDFYYFKSKQILGGSNEVQVQMSQELRSFKLDEIDEILLDELSKNARISLVKLAEKTNMTANGIHNRVKRLEKENIVFGYRVMLDYSKLGFSHHRVFLHLDNLTTKKRKEIISFIGNQKQTVSITETIGYCELEFRSITKDINEFYELIEKIKKQFSEYIKEYNSILYFKFHETLNYFPISKKSKAQDVQSTGRTSIIKKENSKLDSN